MGGASEAVVGLAGVLQNYNAMYMEPDVKIVVAEQVFRGKAFGASKGGELYYNMDDSQILKLILNAL